MSFAPLRGGLVLLMLVVSGCGSPRRSEPIAGPLRLDDSQLALGERVFSVNCQQCHPGGEGGLGPALNDKPVPTWLIRFQVRHGLGAMPAFGPDRISPDELDALLRYMLVLRRNDPPAPG
ncbi:MAG: c-type cytochrome [Gemmatimonadota bacterium]|nr:c-type cytochrome [Gemmatimonadota bacterium]